MLERYLSKPVKKDLPKKMVFISGPRQVGKTTFSKTFLTSNKGYLNWDSPLHREAILRGKLPPTKIWIFDEFHKYRSWRNFLKGIYDTKSTGQKIIVTGSGRLDYYRFGGDSLQGRYHFWRLFPLSVKELEITSQNDFQSLLKLGGFPEPFFSQSELEARRWTNEYRTRLIREDVRDLERFSDLSKLELLALRLPELVGSPLSINALMEDIQTSHKSLSKWLDALERLYGFFRIPPFGTSTVRAVKKAQKHYHYDWTLVKENAYRFENMVGVHLLKWTAYLQDAQGRDVELRYFRDVDGREVDFVIMEDQKPVELVECKWRKGEISKGLKYVKKRFPRCNAFQISAVGKEDYITPDGIRVCPALNYLNRLV